MQMFLSRADGQSALPGLGTQLHAGKTTPHAAGESSSPGANVKTAGDEVQVDGMNVGKGLPIDRKARLNSSHRT